MKIYLYEKARPHGHDNDERYINTVPFSQAGIFKHCEVVKENPSYYYMGQISAETLSEVNQNNFPYLLQYPEKHIADIEGDWAGVSLPPWLASCILTINGCPNTYNIRLPIVRPTMSTLLVNAARNREDEFPAEFSAKQFAFIGLPDPWGVRSRMYEALKFAHLPHSVFFNQQFSAGIPVGHPKQDFFENLMKENLLALCPRGMGHDSVRLYEACFYNRVPILIGDNRVVGEDFYDTSFIFRISQYISVEEMGTCLHNIYSRSTDELLERADAARQYFDDVIREYFADPTEYAIKHYLCEKS